MIFKRIDDENVNCIISESDMQEYDIKVDDFLKNSGKAHNFLKIIVSRAVEEVDFRASERVLSIKMMMLPDNKISIILSENPETNMSNMIDHMKDIAESEKFVDSQEEGFDSEISDDVLDNVFTNSKDLSEEEKENIFEEFMNNFFGSVKSRPNAEAKKVTSDETETKVKKKKTAVNGAVKVFGFNTLKDVEDFCFDIPKKVYVKSSLYKDETQDKFYLVMEKSHISTVKFNSLCEQALEFSCGEVVNKNFHHYVKEHCKLIIENKAAKILKRTAMTI